MIQDNYTTLLSYSLTKYQATRIIYYSQSHSGHENTNNNTNNIKNNRPNIKQSKTASSLCSERVSHIGVGSTVARDPCSSHWLRRCLSFSQVNTLRIHILGQHCGARL